MVSAACRGAGPEGAMGPESVPLYCLAARGANSAALRLGRRGLGKVPGARHRPKPLVTLDTWHLAPGSQGIGWPCASAGTRRPPGRLPGAMTRRLGQVVQGAGIRRVGQAAGEVDHYPPYRPLGGSPSGQVTMKVDDMALRAGVGRLMTHSRSCRRRLNGSPPQRRRAASMACRTTLRRQAARGHWPGCCR